jgi:hypothetical protein
VTQYDYARAADVNRKPFVARSTRLLLGIAWITCSALAACTPVPPPNHPKEGAAEAAGGGARSAADSGTMVGNAPQNDAGSTAPQAGSGGSDQPPPDGDPDDAGTTDAPNTGPNPDSGTSDDASAAPQRAAETPRWTCHPGADNSCRCTLSETGKGATEDNCPTPKPTCCFTRVVDDQSTCECWPVTSRSCLDYRNNDPNPNLISVCPPGE